MDMRARIAAMDSPDVDPLAQWVPADPTDAGALVQLSIAAVDGPAGDDLFDVVVGTPSFFARLGAQSRELVVERWDFPTIKKELESRVAQASGDTWPEVAAHINTWAKWEFAEYDTTPGDGLSESGSTRISGG